MLCLGILLVLYSNACGKIVVRKLVFWVRGFILLGNSVIK